MADGWCIIRCQGRATLRLAQTLAEDGFEVWTPRETRRIRIPKFNVRREAVLPLIPSYVFVRSAHLIDLLELAAMPVKPRRQPTGLAAARRMASASGAELTLPAHASFSVMKSERGIPVVADRDLQALRTLEAKRTPRRKAEPLPPGVQVRVKTEGGSFAGMSGRVERSDEGVTLVCFDRRLTVKIPTSLLAVEQLENRTLTATRRAA